MDGKRGHECTSGLGAGNCASGNLQLPPTTTVVQQPAATQAKYTKVWEGLLGGSRQGTPVPICRLEAQQKKRQKWIFISILPGRACRLLFLGQIHYFLDNVYGTFTCRVEALSQSCQEKNLKWLQEYKFFRYSAVIQLPNQTLLLSTSDKPDLMIGMLFPGDAVVFKPQLPSQPHLHLQQQQQQQQQPQGMASAMGQAFAEGQLSNQTRPQLMSQGQFQGQGPASMPGAGYLS